jgi:arabinofuranosyltransferase
MLNRAFNRISEWKPALLCLALVLVGSGVVWSMMGRPHTGIDDADIFLVYARHLVDGHGFVYNIGGERVEGFTSLLWTLLSAGWFLLAEGVELPLFMMNVVFAATAAWLCLKRARSVGIYLLMLASAPAWFAWSVNTLMESGLWCLLITWMILSMIEGRKGAFTVSMAFMLVTRPEAMLWCGWALLLWGVRYGWRAFILPFCSYLLVLTGLIGFRMAYFGAPVPNTYYAKVSGNLLENLEAGLRYFRGFIRSHPLAIIGVVAVISSLIRGWKARQNRLSDRTILALLLLPGLGIPIVVGGDHFGSFRFYQPLWPLLMLLVVWWSQGWMAQRRSVWVALVIMALFSWTLFPYRCALQHEFRIAREGREHGAVLMELFGSKEPLPRIAVITAGGIKRSYPGTVLDLMGLNSVEMARAEGQQAGGVKNHAAFKASVFWDWRPDMVVCGDSEEFDNRVLRGLYTNESFLATYELRTLNGEKASVKGYILK